MKILIYGAGKIARTIMEKIHNAKFIVVENDDIKSQKIASLFPNAKVFSGDCINSQVTHNAGLDSADVVIAATDDDSINIAAAVYARRFVQNVIAVIQKEEFSEVLKQIGILPLQPNETAGKTCVFYLKYPLIYDLIHIDDVGYRMIEINIDDEFKPLKLKDLPDKVGLVAAIYRNKTFIKLNENTDIKNNDCVLVIFDMKDCCEEVYKFWKFED
ncbi:MAG: hypothetical protein COW47_01370 [Candidatus Huberarchaeum crystalense]|uniref:RCK N-terminal domain-containing protein n=1 Tax=Huberarchaeum crystalense TaxID=2014257 RepID=A0A2G9LJM9_HUBC1|nr:hypothetical protein [archaeon]OIP20663.1 MAG: hypothetical protein AUJ91_00795 [archaeon CG2_30_31_98]PIN66672.1 MAG: hypothetical protein COW69_00880 [Candidatus Huberarchaeum crystalense]NCS98545.1 hypothetical protein [archaeon]PIV13676.1 MAG: hypothetical protein COS45_01580 [Candidatus Huberarchaeum crystalense]